MATAWGTSYCAATVDPINGRKHPQFRSSNPKGLHVHGPLVQLAWHGWTGMFLSACILSATNWRYLNSLLKLQKTVCSKRWPFKPKVSLPSTAQFTLYQSMESCAVIQNRLISHDCVISCASVKTRHIKSMMIASVPSFCTDSLQLIFAWGCQRVQSSFAAG